jgi:MFS family permease
LSQNLLGLAVGPLIAGALSDRWDLSAALSVMPLFSILAAGAFLLASRSYARESPQQQHTALPPVAAECSVET